ncbi:MAG: class I SAM-dependent methyltransferase [candidate division WOR-3 bacterium]|nr:class I SAM-dependent methyltransferase [candidate division WOR-3 bacterium]
MIRWDDYWAQYSISPAEQWLIEQRDEILSKYIDSIKSRKKRVIEIGCGFGSNIRLINSKYDNVETHALDFSSKAIEIISEEIGNTYVADCRDTKLPDNHFDIVYSAGLLEHFRNERPIVREFRRIIKKGGYVITFVPAKYSLWQVYQAMHLGNWIHGYEKAYSTDALKYIMESEGLGTIEITGIDPFSIPGFIIKLTGRKLDFPLGYSPVKSGYTEICIVSKKT